MSNKKSKKRKDRGKEEKEEKEEEICWIEGRNLVFKRRHFNKFFTCGLCEGYLREAHTIRECLHSFCKSCILKYLQTKKTCPTCSVDLGVHPQRLLKFDRALQQLQDKVYPEAKKEDERREAEFFKERGEPNPHEEEERPKKKLKTSQDGEETNEGDEKEKEKEQEKAKELADKERKEQEKKSVSFQCLPYKEEGKGKEKGKGKDTSLPALAKNFINTSADVSIKHVKKFINSQLKGEGLKDGDIEILYQGATMGAEHTLEYIIRTYGIVYKRNEPLTFHYRKIVYE
uniref:RING-type domain-containing protein n=1 Tax=Paramoeba aestuarina TaxID=180227 RepID=A0A7S4P2T1_9EUKA|mmetsp:Transcript_35359/g.55183  ORF Transcript_35359/g.55183 Transcript_35359/m.55183 type:complete len:287 (+) Transcript_35359:108-968(+)